MMERKEVSAVWESTIITGLFIIGVEVLKLMRLMNAAIAVILFLLFDKIDF